MFVAVVVTVTALYFSLGDKEDDLVLLAAGFVLTWSGRRVSRAFVDTANKKRQVAAEGHLRELLATSSDAISVGRLTVPDAQLVALSDGGTEYLDKVEFRFRRQQSPARPDPPEWDLLAQTRLQEMLAKAEKENRLFEDGPKLDVVSVEVQRGLDRRREKTKYFLGWSESTYFRFAAMSNSLDVAMPDNGPTLRERWGHKLVDLTDIAHFPAPACVGTVTVVRSKSDEGDYLLCQERGKLFQVGSTNSGFEKIIHFVGEGMLPASDRLPGGEPSALAAARRGLSEELNIEERSDSDIDFAATGVIFDHKRWQLVFCYLATVDQPIERIEPRRHGAKDRIETIAIYPRRCSIRDPDTRDLLLGTAGRLRLASNHSQAAMLLALLHVEGFDLVEACLRNQNHVL